MTRLASFPPNRHARRQTAASSSRPPAVAPREVARHPFVLLVDDDASVIESLRRVFTQTGLRVATARSGEQAVEQLGVLQPDLVVTDLRMGPVSGVDLVFHYHLHDAGLPFIVITAVPVSEAGGVDQLAAGYFQKPLDLDALLAAIHAGVAPPAPAIIEPPAAPHS